MPFEFEEEARRQNIWLRMLIMGPNGAGKTLGALEIASKLLDGKLPVVGIDTERGRMKLYADEYSFAHLNLHGDYSPQSCVAAIDEAEKRYPGGVLIFDSVSHEWIGAGGTLQMADKFGDWKKVRPQHTEFVDRLLDVQMHVICCVRAKMKYEVSEEDVPGRDKPRQIIRKLGLGPVQDDSLPYEFDVMATIDVNTHDAHFSNRCRALVDTVHQLVPGDEVAATLTKWLSEGEAPPPPPTAAEEDVEALVALLKEAGIPDETIEENFAKARRQNRGQLSPDYIAKNTDIAHDLIAKKQAKEAAHA